MRAYSDDQIALMELSAVQGLTFRQKTALLSLTDSPKELFPSLEIMSEEIARIGEGLFDRLLEVREGFQKERVLNYMEKTDSFALFENDDEYPASFGILEDKPLVLYGKGDPTLLSENCFAIVGTREPTRYGRDAAELFAKDLASAGLVIVSGLARGVDSIAHKAALEVGGKSIGVIGCGVDRVYPSENKGLYDEMAEKGLVLSEYFFGEKPVSFHFPERNRLISALSKGILVVEAGVKSGTLLTVEHAFDQGKDVFAVPGNIFSDKSKGSNELLHNPLVLPACSPRDVLDFYKIDAPEKEEQAVQLTTNEIIVYDLLKDEDKHFEELIAATGLPMGELMQTLTKLEVLGVIKKLPGNYYGI